MAAQSTGRIALGVKIESPEGVSNVEQILSVPGLGFAEMGPGDLGLALGYKQVPREPYPPDMQEARERVFAACCARGIPFLETCTPENIARKIDEGVRVIAGHREETAQVGRAHTKRTMRYREVIQVLPYPRGELMAQPHAPVRALNFLRVCNG